MHPKVRIGLALVAALAIFGAGWALGQKQNKFGTPKTIIHVVTVKFKAEASEADRQKGLDGIKEMAAQIPGIKNVWVKSTRVQPRDFHAAFVIEFEDRGAADLYAEHPAHKEWEKFYLSIRQESRSVQVTN